VSGCGKMKSLADPDIRQSILDRIARVRPDSKPLWGRMSAHQMICHLADSFRAALGEKHVSPATGVLQRTAMKWFALYAPIPWPRGLPTMPEMEQGAGGTPPIEFERDRAGLLQLTHRCCAPVSGAQSFHPLFGELSDFERQRWGYLHMDHHLRQFGL
jgi:hypothetical protein